MRFIRTRMAIDWLDPGNGLFTKLLGRVSPNPGYESQLHQVSEWFIEFDDEGCPAREVGLDKAGAPVLAGPDGKNYGFWLDTNMKLDDFEGERISQETFEEKWNVWRAENAI